MVDGNLIPTFPYSVWQTAACTTYITGTSNFWAQWRTWRDSDYTVVTMISTILVSILRLAMVVELNMLEH